MNSGCNNAVGLLLAFVIVVHSSREEAHYLPWCNGNTHTIGHWSFVNVTKKSFQCCTWDKEFSNDPEVCGNEKITRFYQECYVGSNIVVQQAGGNACSCDAALQGRSTVNARENYDWVPSFCMLHHWNASFFCELLGNRTILLVGDSTMEQSASTLMAMIQSGEGGCADQIKACRSDFLYFGIKQGELSLSRIIIYSIPTSLF